MAKIAFIGLGNMGGPMAANLAKAQHHVVAFDLSDAAVATAVEKGAHKASSAAEAVKGAEIVVTMLPAGKHVREVYEKDVLPNVAKGTLLIDCSTIDVESARHVAALAEKAGLDMVDAPVSGGVGGATAGTLTFMVGGSEASFAKAKPILEKMGKNIVLAGTSGGGQAAKICNNMILGVSMIAVSEAFMLAKRLGLDAQKLFDVASTASGQCWSLTNYCPVPGPVPTSPANRDYQAGFTAAMMLKDLMLAQQAANAAGASTPLGAEAAQLFSLFVNSGNGAKDFSGIIKMLDGK
ncbi:3-hydroxyisobutyrate dehydrogenase [Reyranella sp.]|jgi:3-hydroxyisobutyrate dehydrogenase|uniref:3-hydroxyisobutyrate dehydrogenase n=1 Tax=Reyranella sp. TaxID=1929291 RepID=UPI000BC3D451|nr:3-hydroxyisobutyrate dehydrogenase [Reyranella sp.]OYY44079.1 MAG: 3-hydroxyisobutyrate dehydrogenase [Rhodospirillales bacterium 35-66-84]OYZ94755.1 MAG: 3-hydroxyisobutyrate dehydrogenase [Rhodospirillales bacterium 24-66-33]OZB26170.1 MAG: 3-hydroxyisobutyrate dehydrogenase [Rhodospirillales bacterium 39-66-50]HQS15119.1 3-hydroxyisobutyrate dehydrogenase [Reyranella sp.]HQT10928.1 3-hydroxyisobutyrate dehydrogenase [Reyranella sp.]